MPRRTTTVGTRRRSSQRHLRSVEPRTYLRFCEDCGHVEESDNPRLMDWRECPSCARLDELIRRQLLALVA